jgi:hypothetical protein
MPSTSHSQRQTLASSKLDRRDNIRNTGGMNDQRGTPIVHRIINLACLIVSQIFWLNEISAETADEMLNRLCTHAALHTGAIGDMKIGQSAVLQFQLTGYSC